MGNVPNCVGVPTTEPAGVSDKPVGKVPEFNVNVVAPMVFEAVKGWLNTVPTVPVVTAGLVTGIV